jgi:anti-sigma regulatory factor (Ser/Thr protein kinase)
MPPADGSSPPTSLRAFEPDVGSIAEARDEVERILRRARPPDARPTLIGDVQLAVSELTSNAVAHGSGPFTLRIETTGESVHCSVTSWLGDAEPPLVRDRPRPTADARSGRGLAIVAALATSVSTSVEDGHLVVTCEFAWR